MGHVHSSQLRQAPRRLGAKLIAKTESGSLPSGTEAGVEKAGFGGASGESRIPAKYRRAITESMKGGFTQLSPAEQVKIAHLMHNSPGLRKVVGDIAEYSIGDMGLRQTDPSLLPPLYRGRVLEDALADESEAARLAEDLKALGQQPK